MGKKVESYQSDDGKLFQTEEGMLTHEAESLMREEFPNLKMSLPLIMDNAKRISEIMEPLASYYRKNHPKASSENHPDEEDMLCDCSASMAGNGGPHAKTCSIEVARRTRELERREYELKIPGRYDKDKGLIGG